MERASGAKERRRARIAYAAAVIDEAVGFGRNGQTPDVGHVREAFEFFDAELRETPGLLEPSLMLLRAALLLGEGDSAWFACRSYYQLGPDTPFPGDIADALRDLERRLPSWNPAEAPASERAALVLALADARFFAEAALLAGTTGSKDKEHLNAIARVRDIVAYAEAIDRVTRISEEYYRQTALGRSAYRSWRRQLNEQAETLWSRLNHAQKITPRYSFERLQEALKERFGTWILLGRSTGARDLHMGHAIVDENRKVEQYGHHAKVKFVVLEAVVSNGYQSWVWEDGSEHGGWANEDGIFQVRRVLANIAARVWDRVHDPAVREERQAETVRESKLDLERARQNPHAYLPGVAMRLANQGYQQILDRLKTAGVEGPELRSAFIAEFTRNIVESGVFAHEGRHIIDLEGDYSSAELEFRAKLSEVAFAPVPRLAFPGIIDSNLGDGTPHGEANLRIIQGLVVWMKENPNDIESFDGSLPLLPQLNKLTDDQLRRAMRSMDPLAP